MLNNLEQSLYIQKWLNLYIIYPNIKQVHLMSIIQQNELKNCIKPSGIGILLNLKLMENRSEKYLNCAILSELAGVEA